MKPRVLIVDDEPSIQKLLGIILTREGFTADCASDLCEAETLLARSTYDLILVDLYIGSDNGVDLLRKIQHFDKHAQVVLITGNPGIESAAEAARLGALDYLTKPLNVEQVIATALRAVRNKQLISENERQRQNMDAIFRSVSEAIILVDREANLLQFNDMASQLCEYSPDHLSSSILTTASHCEGTCRKVFADVLDKGVKRHLRHIECRKKDGAKRVVSLTVSPVVDDNDCLGGAVGVIRDESELVLLQKQLSRQSGFGSIIGRNIAMQRMYTLLEALADVQTTVLVNGESGTGKELVAAALHHHGARRDRPFVKVNCSALSEHLLESELFGHVRGAFTGAVSNKIGRFQKADSGTIFLDEIGDISIAMQMRLLRVLQEQEFEQVGDSTPIKVDVRVIAATNQNLAEKVRLGTFRHDLYYRLNVVRLIIPPLRDRLDDIPLLVNHFLEKFSRKFDKQLTAVSDEVMEFFLLYSWPGNVRELQHIIEHAAILASSPVVTRDVLPQDFLDAVLSPAQATAFEPSPSTQMMGLEEALQKTGGNKAKAARLLGISRATLYNRLSS